MLLKQKENIIVFMYMIFKTTIYYATDKTQIVMTCNELKITCEMTKHDNFNKM